MSISGALATSTSARLRGRFDKVVRLGRPHAVVLLMMRPFLDAPWMRPHIVETQMQLDPHGAC